MRVSLSTSITLLYHLVTSEHKDVIKINKLVDMTEDLYNIAELVY